ncbi:MAG: UbiA-like polyprenyltransferase [Desulfococcaceae bacterium]
MDRILAPVWKRIRTYGRMIKFSHTIFALPFALAAVVLAARDHAVTLAELGWILMAMVGARSAAMGFNRLVDAEFDARNPRTASREIPAGILSKTVAAAFVILSGAVFVGAAAMLGTLPFLLSFPVLAALLGYSYAKRFTWLAHFYLGAAISLAPAGAWVAVTGGLDPAILILSLALMTHIAGFDILYACQDVDFDIAEGLRSVPARFGVRTALRSAALVHMGAFAAFLALHFAFGMGRIYLMTVGVIGFLLLFEHWLVPPDDLGRVPVAFFHVNSIVAAVLFLGVLADTLAGGR